MTYQITTLPNGMQVASEFLAGVESVAVAVSVGTGARYEDEITGGISHLLEHMAFKGTTTRSARDIAEIFDEIGGQLNAYTGVELTVYYAKVLKQDARLAVEVLADIMQNSIFAEDELVREKEVIIQEIAMHHDTPDDLIVDYFDATAFAGQPLGRPILGTAEKILSYSSTDLQTHMKNHYRPQDMVLSAAGNIEHTDFVAMVEQFFNMPKMEDGKAFAVAQYVGGENRTKADFEQLHLMIGLPTVSIHSSDYYALQLYTTILGGGMSSRLFQEVREKRGLAYTVYAFASAYEDVGMMNIYAAASPDKAQELSNVLCEQIASMCNNISDSEINRAKNQQKAEMLMARENPSTVASWIGRHLLLFGEYREVDFIATRIDAVNKEQLLSLAKKIASGKPTIAALGDVSHIPPYQELSKKLLLI